MADESKRVDVLAVIDQTIADHEEAGDLPTMELHEARAAVAELIEANRCALQASRLTPKLRARLQAALATVGAK